MSFSLSLCVCRGTAGTAGIDYLILSLSLVFERSGYSNKMKPVFTHTQVTSQIVALILLHRAGYSKEVGSGDGVRAHTHHRSHLMSLY